MNNKPEDFIYHPREINNVCCKYCGISSFSHSHKKGSLPKEFERVEENLIHPCKNCGDIYCKNLKDGKCVGNLFNHSEVQEDWKKRFKEQFDQYAFEFPRIRGEIISFIEHLLINKEE